MIADISCDPDTASWHKSIKEKIPADSLKQDVGKHIGRYWVPAPFNIKGLEKLPIAAVPWFIAADSSSRVLYCGPSVTTARNAVK